MKKKIGDTFVVGSEKIRSLRDIVKEAATYLKTSEIENPRLDAERLMGDVLGLSRAELYLSFDRLLKASERERYKNLVRRRAAHQPLQYILGETEFMALSFKVTPDVLIPRPETEILVEKIIETVKNQAGIRILDIGTGSGNIAVSLARYLKSADVVAVDSSPKALSVARENARMHRVEGKVRFLQSDIREPHFAQAMDSPFDLVVSNPPYISAEAWDDLPIEIRQYEPKSALCDGEDGLVFFRIIAQKGRQLLRSDGRLFFEVGDGQHEEVKNILRELKYQGIVVYPDLNGIERVVVGVWTGNARGIRSRE